MFRTGDRWGVGARIGLLEERERRRRLSWRRRRPGRGIACNMRAILGGELARRDVRSPIKVFPFPGGPGLEELISDITDDMVGVVAVGFSAGGVIALGHKRGDLSHQSEYC